MGVHALRGSGSTVLDPYESGTQTLERALAPVKQRRA